MLKIIKINNYNRTCANTINYLFVRRLNNTASDVMVEDLTPSAVKPIKLKKTKMEEPFMKSVFNGQFNPKILTYPEIPQERLDPITEYVADIESYFTQNVNSKLIDETGKIPEDVLKNLTNLDLFNLKIPNEFNGRDLPETERSFVREATGSDLSIANFLMSHQDLATAAVSQFGSASQKLKYLPRIKNGSCIPCFCFYEYKFNDQYTLSSVAIPLEDGSFEINAEKNWITNAGVADLFIVLASTYENTTNQRTPKITAFLVDKNTPGVTIGKPEDKLGVRGLSISDVTFKNVIVSKDQILGDLDKGINIIHSVVNNGKLNIGPQCCAVMKKLIHDVVQHCIHTKQFGKPLTEYESIQGAVGDMVLATYAVESMTYLYSGMIDSYEEPDIMIESLIMKVAPSEALNFVVQKSIDILGHKAYLKNHDFERVNRDAQFHLLSDDTNVNLKLSLAYMGVQHAGQYLNEVIKKNRNPLQFPAFAIKKILFTKDQLDDKVKLTQTYGEYLHPSLMDAANCLEYCVLRLSFAVEHFLAEHGNLAIDKHLDAVRLANVACDIFALTAVLGRASRSYCIGLTNSTNEMEIAFTYCEIIKRKVAETVKEIIVGGVVNQDNRKFNIAKHSFNVKSYGFEHPLTRNF